MGTLPIRPDGTRLAQLAHVAADLIRNAGDAILAVDITRVVISWNDAATELLGWSAAEIMGEPVPRLVPEPRRGELDRVIRALLGTREHAAIETVRLHKSGAERPVTCRLSPLI